MTSSVDGWLLKEEMNHKRRERDRKEHWPDLWEQVGGCEAPQDSVVGCVKLAEGARPLPGLSSRKMLHCE